MVDQHDSGAGIFVLAGNPNAGKTTLFNALTGLRQKVANYPGVTVERKQGAWKTAKGDFTLIDLPGLYSLNTSSLDEKIAQEVISGEVEGIAKPDVVITVVDSTNLERNLYLVTQIIALEVPVVIALTMVDMARKSGHDVRPEAIAKDLGVPVVEVIASQGIGVKELEEQVLAIRGTKRKIPAELIFDEDSSQNSRIFGRYAFISKIIEDAVEHSDLASHDFSQKIDRVLTHKFFGPLVLLAVLLLVFQAIFSWAELPMTLLEEGFGALGDFARSVIPAGILADLVIDGIIAGVGGVLVFLPQILMMFLFISILEDTGYMARAAFLLDKMMSRFGLHGRSFLPLMSSFACAIPGIMAARTIENQKDRLVTILIAPFMSCSARLPVYAVIIASVFSGKAFYGISAGAIVMLSMYVLGIIVAVTVGLIFKKTALRTESAPFVMELPPYRLPDIKTVFYNMYQRAGLFVRRAGTVILALSILVWAMMNFPRAGEGVSRSAALESSVAGRIGKLIEPTIEPLGFDWRIGIGLISSFAARETFVSTMSVIYEVSSDEAETDKLHEAFEAAKRDDGTRVWTPLTGLSLMVFFVLAMQCVSTIAIVRRETNSWKWTLFMIAYMTALAYFASLILYQGGKMLGFE